ncbi:dihydrolipoyl dehydrogenase [Sporomusa acidovorans]|uniref:Dihydrolipoyl dehydrogenase n=1 Tax=Sporomusa acidovorans (strain ATCC 49682 / DSM 3132 / Mol) TaxID=1123286 RepID=A0ABZ3J754_SPOA4|nr:dihydrolipoyl dehydrogenase [Sporomusa acidovorans]OZC18474.1 dihydrolipoyl dehydrogenase [Sporomusa acidovorans DSM 3132]SDE36014.1 dihydrolipoamide dehydrogenase [Sporomusa acidovorans]
MEIKIGFIMGPSPVTVGMVFVKPGDRVKSGDKLMEYEAQKGVIPVIASKDGTVQKVLVTQGDKVNADDILFEVNDVFTEAANETSADIIKETDMNCELLIIGAGPGGYVAAIRAAQCGIETIVVEKGEVGGTCLNEGCIPTKAFVKTAQLFHEISESERYGIHVQEADVNFAKVIRRKNEVRDQLRRGVDSLLREHGVKILNGVGSFCSEKQVDVAAPGAIYHVTAKNIIIATGSKISQLQISGADLPVVLNSQSVLDLEKLPSSITIVGGGVIGMEFASILVSLGVKVHVVEFLDRVLAMLDKDVSGEIQELLQSRGVQIHTSSKVMSIEQSVDGQAIVTYQQGEEVFRLVSERVLISIGREPNLDNLQLEKAGVKLCEKKRGIEVNEFMQTNVPHIYAIGDVTNVIQLAHVASHQGFCAINNILGQAEKMDYSVVPNVVFTNPEAAAVGMTEAECERQRIAFRVAKFPYYANGKALIMNETKGFVKLVQDSTSKKIIGASIVGPDADTAINILSFAIRFGLTDKDIASVIFPHPTTSETIFECASGLTNASIHLHKNDYLK